MFVEVGPIAHVPSTPIDRTAVRVVSQRDSSTAVPGMAMRVGLNVGDHGYGGADIQLGSIGSPHVTATTIVDAMPIDPVSAMYAQLTPFVGARMALGPVFAAVELDAGQRSTSSVIDAGDAMWGCRSGTRTVGRATGRRGVARSNGDKVAP